MRVQVNQLGEARMVDQERWAEIRRLYDEERVSISEIGRRLDVDRKTVRHHLRHATWRPYHRAAETADLHRPSPTARELARILCLKTTRVVRRDWTVAHQGRLYQLDTPVRATQVLVEERLDGTLVITHHGRPLRSHAIATRPVPVSTPSPRAAASRQANARSSMAKTVVAGPTPRRGRGRNINRTFLIG